MLIFSYAFPYTSNSLCKLLLDEERAQIAQLPSTSHSKDSALNERPSHDSGIDSLAHVAELNLSFSLEGLLAPDVLYPHRQILDLRYYVANLLIVAALDRAGRADCEIELHLDTTELVTKHVPAARGGNVCGGEAHSVIAGFGCCEGESAIGFTALRDDAMVVVKNLVNGDEHALEENGSEELLVAKKVSFAYQIWIRLICVCMAVIKRRFVVA